MTVSRLTQSQRQSLGFRQIQAINLLRLTNEDLAADLARRAVNNPFLRLRLPAATASAGPEEIASHQGGLYAHVTAQLRLISAARADETLALVFVEALDCNGWLDRPLAAIAASAGRSISQAEALLAALQQGIEPAGLFASDLADCLRLQAIERGQHTPAMAAVLRHLDLLAQGGAAVVANAAALHPDEVAICLAQMRRMDPRPGLAFGGDPAPLRAPDVIVSHGTQGWQVALNRATLPELTVVPKDRMGTGMKAVRSEAEWLASMVERRNRTVLAVARAVLNRQREFLDHGPEAMLVLSRSEIAADLGLHGSTIGRVARNLLVETPHGMRTLCSLFHSGPVLAGTLGRSVPPPAAEAIQHRLRQLVAAEDPAAPLSDAALAAILSAEGKPLARRTVAKYREVLDIPIRDLRRKAKVRPSCPSSRPAGAHDLGRKLRDASHRSACG